MINRVLAGLFIVFAMAGSAAAGPLQDGDAAYKRGDYATALKLWRPFAEQGDAISQYGLGVLYLGGHGVPQDDIEAAKWFRLAAEQGNAGGEAILGSMYSGGQGAAQDYAAAVKWSRLAADQGDAGGQFNLGVAYAKGEGVPQDYVEAHMWLNLPAGQGVKDAAKSRDIVAAKMTPDQIAEAQRMAREWKPTPAQ